MKTRLKRAVKDLVDQMSKDRPHICLCLIAHGVLRSAMVDKQAYGNNRKRTAVVEAEGHGVTWANVISISMA